MYQGDFVKGSSVVFNFNTASFSDGSPITLAGSPVLSCYKDSTTEITAGITLTVDYDSRTGMHHVVIDTSNAAYVPFTDYDVIITTGTVGGTSVVGRKVGSFSLENRDIGVLDSGIAQSASGTGIVQKAGAVFGDGTLIGATLVVYGTTQGYKQSRSVIGNVNSTEAITVDAWTVTPTGTIYYRLFAGAPGSVASPPAVNVTQILGTASQGAAGYIGTDHSKITNPTATVNLSGTTVGDIGLTILGNTFSKTLALIMGRLWGRTSGLTSGAGTATVKTPDNATTQGTIAVDANGNRTSVTIN